MAEKKTEPKIVLEREYLVPLRKEWLKVPSYKRVPKAVKTLRKFIARHMKLYDSDLRKVKIDMNLNNELRFRGIKNPPAKVRVKAIKYDDNTVKVQLIKLPDRLKFKKSKEEKKREKLKKKIEARREERKADEGIVHEEKSEEDKEAKEKETSAKEEMMKFTEKQAKQAKHATKIKDVVQHRKALAK